MTSTHFIKKKKSHPTNFPSLSKSQTNLQFILGVLKNLTHKIQQNEKSLNNLRNVFPVKQLTGFFVKTLRHIDRHT